MSAAAKAVFEADSSKLDSALLRVQQSMLKLQKVVALVHYGFAALKAVGNLISKEFEHVKESMTLGKELNELSARTGIAVGDLVELRSEFKKVGKGTEDIGPAINKMQRNLAEGKAADVIKKMGLNMEAMKRMTPLEQFHELGRAIGGLQNPMDRADAAMKIFGRTGRRARAKAQSSQSLRNRDRKLVEPRKHRMSVYLLPSSPPLRALRLCAFARDLQRIHQPLDVALDQFASEVDQETEFHPGKAQISDHLFAMHRGERLDGLQFHQDKFFHNQIGAKALIKLFASEANRDLFLSFHSKPRLPQHAGKQHLID